MEQVSEFSDRRVKRDGSGFFPDVIPFVILVVFGVTCFCGRSLTEKALKPQALAGLIILTAAMAAVLFMLRLRLATYFRRGSTSGSWLPLCLTDAVLILLLTVLVPAVDQQFYPMVATQKDMLVTLGYNAAVVTALAVMCRWRLHQDNIAALTPAPLPLLSASPLEAPIVREPASANVHLAEPPHYAEAEGHYVKLVFNDRVEHRRARFRDVVNDLGPSGMQVHKSFWVKREAVAAMRRVGRKLLLVLSCGSEIPVGRANERAVADALPALLSRSRD